MDRRQFLAGCAALPLAGSSAFLRPARATGGLATIERIRPTSPDWPSEGVWAKLNDAVGGQLVKVETPLASCKQPDGADACAALFKELKNPYYIRDQVGITQ